MRLRLKRVYPRKLYHIARESGATPFLLAQNVEQTGFRLESGRLLDVQQYGRPSSPLSLIFRFTEV